MVSGVFEDYLEAILVVEGRRGFVRTKDLARELSVSPPSVSEMLSKLSTAGLIEYERYQPVRLTPKGLRIAKAVYARHETIKKLLQTILVSDRTAEADACKIEHQLSDETIEQLRKFMEFLESNQGYKDLKGDFRRHQG
ncbi:MAG: metal-dependent transcriptional regulator [Candidatus Altiarchaeota archaeon]|nr:metal-dependent transcriptional regulator [Candidatus Altiarchaeota archaeon]